MLKEEWDTFYVDCYESNKNLNVLHGVHVQAFIERMISKVINFIAKLLEVNTVTKNLIILLKSYQNITKILSITRIKDKKKYNN